ncbi:MAG: hypothetical protein CYPHOPRED_001781 [Cyphobasidiales sp. Tagirdzhanova-0007]|nr:MAG: hypothetical protein CYPHOPRED_001781 [Cyphobasidiales sp. Tagirdzhanova-0007]
MAKPNANYTAVESVPEIVSRLRKTFDSGKTKDVQWRKNQLKSLAFMVRDNERELCDSVASVEKWAKPQKVTAPLPHWIMRPKIYQEPKGVALIIGAWNYPLQLTLQPLGGAISAGCTAVVKVSELNPNVGKVLAKLVPRYLDPSAYTVVLGEVELATKLLEEPWGQIFYTGNSKVARSIAVAAAKTLSPLCLELGGKSPVIIDSEFSDLDVAAKRILWGKRFNGGQTCIAPDFIVVQKEKQNALVAALERQHRLVFPTGDLEQDEFSRIISPGHFARLHDLMAKTNGKVAVGAEKDGGDEAKRRMPLSIVRDVTWEDELMKGEIFGPILPIVPVTSTQDALDQMKGSTPLALYVFSNRKDFTDRIRENTLSGAMIVNDTVMHHSIATLPFGGVGESGQGNYHGKKSFDAFTHERSYATNPIWADFIWSLRYYPHTDAKMGMLRGTYKKITFARPGETPALFAVGGLGKRVLALALYSVAAILLASRWNWIMAQLPRYRLVRVQ